MTLKEKIRNIIKSDKFIRDFEDDSDKILSLIKKEILKKRPKDRKEIMDKVERSNIIDEENMGYNEALKKYDNIIKKL